MKPLSAIASGGEISRIMLAMKAISAENEGVDTMIFDEIDTGVSGRMAQTVGEKMCALGRSRQVICVTHLAQIAALAINVYPLKGTVDAVEEDGRVLVTPADGGEQVVLSLPDGVTMEAGETATFYTNGMATMSIPAQMNAIGVVK